MSVNKTVALTRKPRDEPVCLRLSEIATLVGGECAGDADPLVTGVSGIEDARPGDLTFLASGRYRKKLRDTQAAAVLVRRDEPIEIPAVRVDDPALAFTIVLRRFAQAVRSSRSAPAACNHLSPCQRLSSYRFPHTTTPGKRLRCRLHFLRRCTLCMT